MTNATNTPNVPDHAVPSDANGDHVPDWLIPNALYDVLKWLAVLVLPALSVLIAALGPVWGWGTLAQQLATTVNAVTLFVGAVIGVSAIKGASSAK